MGWLQSDWTESTVLVRKWVDPQSMLDSRFKSNPNTL